MTWRGADRTREHREVEMMGIETAEPQCEARDLEDRRVVYDGSNALAEATVEMLRELSRAHDPQKLVEIFRARSASIAGGDGGAPRSKTRCETSPSAP